MNYTASVCEGERLTHSPNDPQTFGKRRSSGHVTVEARAGHQFHRVEGAAVGQHACLIDGHDRGMLELCDEPRFAGKSGVNHFESDAAIEFEVARSIHDTHATASDLGVELVSSSGEIGKRSYAPQMVDNRVAQIHMRRISCRNSRSPLVTPRSRSVTSARSVRRAQAKWFVTEVSGMSWRAARSA